MNNAFLIDTHILLWYIQGNEKLSSKIISLINDSNNLIYVSKVSLWEITIKLSIGKLTLGIPLEDLNQFLIDRDFDVLDFDLDDLAILKTLPFYHTDPFDRLIIAQAMNQNFCLISDDGKFGNYSELDLF